MQISACIFIQRRCLDFVWVSVRLALENANQASHVVPDVFPELFIEFVP